MKEKGFTLIELLAVIVILAIIALIATPIILNIISDSKEESNKRSVEMYGSAVKNAVAKHQLNKNESISGTFTASEDGKTLTKGETTLTIEYNGNVKCETIEIYEDGNIYLADCSVNGIETTKTYGPRKYANGDVVYFNVDTGEKCDNYNETQSATGIKNGCMKFYAFNDFGGDKVNLILDHNTTDYIAWNSSLINGNGPNELILQLETDTANWKGTQEPKNYTGIGCSEMLEDETSCKENSEYIINYDNKTARLITAEEIARITKNIGWTTSTGWYYLDSKKTVRLDNCTIGNTSGCNYGWLYDRTIICKQYGCLNEAIGSTVGYWTASPITIDSNYAWRISAGGILGGTKINDVENLGVRPVIEVLKSKLL